MFDFKDLPLIEAYVHIAGGFIIMDNESNILISNKLADEILGAPLQGRHIDDFIVGPNPHKKPMHLKSSKIPLDAIVNAKTEQGKRIKLYTFGRRPFKVRGEMYQAGFFTLA